MPAPSHQYAFPARALLSSVGRVLGGVLLVSLAVHIAARLDWLPAAVPGDLDHTLIAEKARLAGEIPDPRRRAISVVLVGDSSCLMDVDAIGLEGALKEPVLNLATLSYLDLEAHGELLAHFVRTHPGSPAAIVLLVHPEALRRGDSAPAYLDFLRRCLEPGGLNPGATSRRAWEVWLGAPIFRERVVQAAVPPLLTGAFGVEYGSTREVSRRLRRSQGGLVDPGVFRPGLEQGSGEYRLSSRIEESSRRFREQVPDHARLLLGITPVPASLAGTNHPKLMQALMVRWAEWLRPDRVLTSLPAILPDDRFATRTHLNPAGRSEYTRSLAEAMRSGP